MVWFAGIWRDRAPVAGFGVRFGLLAVVFYAVILCPWFDRVVFANYLRANAAAGSVALRVLGVPASSYDTTIHLPKGGVTIRRGCDALEPTALLGAALLAFPAAWRRRAKGLVIGTVLLGVLNLARIVTLCLSKLYWPDAFDPLHLELWPVALILSAIGYWFWWARDTVARGGNHAQPSKM